MPNVRDLSGQSFGRLTAMAFHDRIERSAKMFRRWRCLCECGSEVIAATGDLTSGNTQSCGCLKNELSRERLTTHGCTGIPEYSVWNGMVRRCTNPKSPAFKDYGGRGITVCERWRVFVHFYADMGKRPLEDMTLERVRNSEGYKPDNCVWASKATQCRNQRQRIDNSTGVTGVVWNAPRRKYEAFIGFERRRIYLGLFDSILPAAEARRQAMARLGFGIEHGDRQS